jgi:hypothetical protein
MSTAFNYGDYEKLYEKLHADKRTWKALKCIDKAAKKLGIDYALIGGLAAYMHVKNPPEDYPDIDIQIYSDAENGERLIKAIAKYPKFHLLQFENSGVASFGVFIYDKEIQIDAFTDLEQADPTDTKRMQGVEPVEYLVIEKLMRGKSHDIKVVLDLLAFMDYDKALLSQLSRERHLTGVVGHIQYFARMLRAGRLTDTALNNIVSRLSVE